MGEGRPASRAITISTVEGEVTPQVYMCVSFLTMLPFLLTSCTQVRSRVGIKVTDDGRKVRYLKKTGEELPERSFKLAAPAEESSSSSESTGSSGPAAPGGDSSA